MRACSSGALFVAAGLLAGCGGQSPSAPSSVTSPVSPSAAGIQSVVAATMNQAAVNAAVTVSPDGLTRTISYPCADGGSTSVTFTATSPVTSGTFTSSSRIDFTDCKSQTVTINGDPAILMDGTFTITGGSAGAPTGISSTTHETGGLRFDAPGTSGRSRYDCTVTLSMQVGPNGVVTQPTFSYSGTITWEQPLGTVTVHACGS